MPIKGLTEQRRFPRIGKVKIGKKAMSESGKEYPKAIDHFIFDVKDEKLKKTAEQLFGENPKVLTIGFPIDDEAPFEQVFPQYYKCYKQSLGLVCKGDGETANSVQEDGTLKEITCPCDKLEEDKLTGKKPSCRRQASLKFVIAKFPALGIWQLDTGGVNAIMNINSALDMTRKVAKTIKGIPFRLSLEEQIGQVEGKRKKFYVLQLKPVSNLVNQMLIADGGEDPKALGTGLKDDELETRPDGVVINKRTGRPI